MRFIQHLGVVSPNLRIYVAFTDPAAQGGKDPSLSNVSGIYTMYSEHNIYQKNCIRGRLNKLVGGGHPPILLQKL